MRRWKRCGLEHELRGMATRQRLHLTATSCRFPRSLGRYLRHRRRRVIACRAPARQVRVGGRERRDMDQRLQRAVGERVLSLSEYGEQAQNVWRTRTRVGWPCLPRTPCSNSASIRGRVHTRARDLCPVQPEPVAASGPAEHHRITRRWWSSPLGACTAGVPDGITGAAPAARCTRDSHASGRTRSSPRRTSGTGKSGAR